VWRDRAGNTLATAGPEGDFREFRLAPDERRIVTNVVDRDAGKRDLWMFDSADAAAARLTFAAVASKPIWSPDGSRVYFTDTGKLRWRSIGATESHDVENPGGLWNFEDITRDGRFFVLKSPAPLSTLWIQSVNDSSERRLLARDPLGLFQARLSPDGRWIAYRSGRGLVYVQPFDRPGDPLQVSTGSSLGPIWRGDGRELYFEAGQALMAIPIAERNGALIIGSPQKLFAIRTQRSVTNQPHNVEVAANGQKFLVNTIVGDSDNAPLEVTLNAMAALKR
jgi:Tol biopolymer transport system component